MNENKKACGTCNQPENFQADSQSELRPYGKGGALICYRCAMKPENEAEAKRQFKGILDGIEASGQVPMLTDDGVVPAPPSVIAAVKGKSEPPSN
jgi:hypothetical protein